MALRRAPTVQPEHLRARESDDALVIGERAAARGWRDLHDGTGAGNGDGGGDGD